MGRHVRQALQERGHNVVAPTSAEWDITSPIERELAGIDAIVHLAARVHMLRDADPNQHYRINTEATLRLGRSAARQGVQRFVFMSTVKVNGERTLGAPFSDADVPAPTDAYAHSKWQAEQGLRAIGGIDVVCLRSPLVYGPEVKGNFLRFMRLVASGIPLPLASIENARSMIYVGNLAAAVVRALSGPRGSFLVSDDADLSTPEVARRLASAMGRRARLVPCPPRLIAALGAALGRGEEVMRMLESLRVDCSGFKRQFQWTVPFTIEQGFQHTADWFARARTHP